MAPVTTLHIGDRFDADCHDLCGACGAETKGRVLYDCDPVLTLPRCPGCAI